MKRNNYLLIMWIFTLVFVSCMSIPEPAPAPVKDELDVAIRETSDYLNGRIPAGSKIVILNIQSDSAKLSDYIAEELIANTVNDDILAIVDREQLDIIRAEQHFQLSSEVDDATALSIGRFLSAHTIVSGKISVMVDNYRLTVRALNVQTTQVQGQYNRNIFESRMLNNLIAGIDVPAAVSDRSPTGTVSDGTASAGSKQPVQPTPKPPQAPKQETGKEAYLWTLGASIGTSFAVPGFIGTVHGTLAPWRNSFFDVGLDIGLGSGDQKVDYYSLYPYAHFAYFRPFKNRGGWYAGGGGGIMVSRYDFPMGKVALNYPVLAITTGVNLLNMLDISWTLRTNFVEAGSKFAVGYVYRF